MHAMKIGRDVPPITKTCLKSQWNPSSSRRTKEQPQIAFNGKFGNNGAKRFQSGQSVWENVYNKQIIDYSSCLHAFKGKCLKTEACSLRFNDFIIDDYLYSLITPNVQIMYYSSCNRLTSILTSNC